MWRRQRFSRAWWWRTGALTLLVSVVGSLAVSAVLFAWYAKDLPRPDKIVRREGFATRIFDRNGELLYDVFGDQRRTSVSFDQIPEHLRQATVAIEDKDFYKHQGFDPKGILRAAVNIVFRGKLQGGSTLTQQLVKNVLLTSERRLGRKIKEFILAVQIEKKFNKDEILQMYLNEAPYGGTAWGVESAAETYFGKKVGDLSVVEAAILAGMPQRPSAYSPFGTNPKAYIGRTEQVLRRMREDGYISKLAEEQARSELAKIQFAPQDEGIKAPHFVMYVKDQLEQMFGEALVEGGGLQVVTSLDWPLQEVAQDSVSEEIAKVESVEITNGAALVEDANNGEILAMVGSKDFFAQDYEGQVNVVLSKRQPGSAIKPVTYLAAFRKGFTPASVVMDVRTEFPSGVVGEPDYAPENYDGKYHGPLQLRFALGSSINIPAVKVLAMVGLKDMLQVAYDLGFTTLEPTPELMKRVGLSVTLGGGEVRLLDMVSAYGSVANGGRKIEPVAILRVTDREGKVLFEHKSVEGRRVVSEQEAFLVNHILSDNNARLITFGENSLIHIRGRSIAVKTGTTNDQRDNWTAGWTRDSVVGVWVGNNDNHPMKQVASGVSGAAPIWRRIFLEVLKRRPDQAFSVPAGVTAQLVDTVSGWPAHHGFPARSEYFIDGTLPVDEDPIHPMLAVCKASGKLATEVDIAKGDYEEKEYFVFKETDPLSSDGRNWWQEGIDAWIATQADSRYHPPTEKCDQNEAVLVKVVKPTDKEKVDSNDVEIQIEVVGGGEVEWVKIYVDGAEKEKLTGKAPYKKTLFLETGSHAVGARAKFKNDDKEYEANEIRIGVKVPWDYMPPTPAPSPTPTPTP
ncbi:MAG: hypothetical protein A2784_01120 [Candidatus Chisholmbacteria bacterium RIFCSPHIGHO2_01_FULL_48_12]|uniref:Uncharacterized protein n=1 Tax=Candidatus Chisholmbacteria bacterium RIFCSPHIGHO2_01_FULL_48_12 TaxID=1797589 RepID=A0A1G1VJN8_9BACT|nr:MAG: hypothetical protein A2784_01120 [Candidatus Chisholmbacteria bacterium RIFCSPHIGHO2_01_FULL_48_12]